MGLGLDSSFCSKPVVVRKYRGSGWPGDGHKVSNAIHTFLGARVQVTGELTFEALANH